MQQATVNLFADMGVQPATPGCPAWSPAAASTDTTAADIDECCSPTAGCVARR